MGIMDEWQILFSGERDILRHFRSFEVGLGQTLSLARIRRYLMTPPIGIG